MSGLGIAAIVIGALTLCIAWVPVIGMLGVPIAGIGLLLGIAGAIVAGASGRSGVVPSTGALLCLVSIGLTFLATGSKDLSGRGSASGSNASHEPQPPPVNMIGKTGPFKPDLPKADPRKDFPTRISMPTTVDSKDSPSAR
jgi:hypothetical protein